MLLKNKKDMKKQERHGRIQSRNSHGSRGRSKSKTNIKCYHYNKLGHMKKECKILKREQNEGKKNNQENNTIFAKGDIVIVCDDGFVSLTS